MITSKQRAFLRKMSATLDPVVQLGKGDIDEDVMFSINGVLDTRELIKVTILQNSDLDPKAIANDIANVLHADVVSVVGRKFVLYRRSTKKGVKHVEIEEVKEKNNGRKG